jgi:uncharacterized protein (DUF849 family)
MRTDRSLIEVCVNGALDRAAHPKVPLTPAELARDVRDSVAAGAGAVHLHPRAHDGRETLDPDATAAAIEAVRAACPGIPLGVTTIITAAEGDAARLELVRRWEVLPDFASVNVFEPGAEDVAELLDERGVGVEAGLTGPEDVATFARWRLASRCLRVLVEVPQADPDWAAAAAAATEQALFSAAIEVPQLHHGEGRATWAVLDAAIARGHDVRIGLEDTQHLPDGRPAAGNAELVTHAVALARSLGSR